MVSLKAASDILEGQHEAEAAGRADVLADRQLWIITLLVALHQRLALRCFKLAGSLLRKGYITNTMAKLAKLWKERSSKLAAIGSLAEETDSQSELNCIFGTPPRTGSKSRIRRQGRESDQVQIHH